MKNFLGSLKHKPRKIDLIALENANVAALANSVDGSIIPKDSQILSILTPRNDDQKQKEIAKQKLAKMAAYQKSIHELYMPKLSEKKKNEREQKQAKLVNHPRETKPYEDYLSAVADMNKKQLANGPKRLTSVGSLPSLPNSEQKNNISSPIGSPMGEMPASHFRRGRQSQPFRTNKGEEARKLE